MRVRYAISIALAVAAFPALAADNESKAILDELNARIISLTGEKREVSVKKWELGGAVNWMSRLVEPH